VRRVYRGVVTQMVLDKEHQGLRVTLRGSLRRLGRDESPGQPTELPVDASTPDPDSFLLQLPQGVPPPFNVGDTVQAELWTVEVGAFARDYHVRITGANGEPLLYVFEVPEGWTVGLGPRVNSPSDFGAIHERALLVTPPQGTPTPVSGWRRGERAGTSFGVYGYARIFEGGVTVPPPNDWANTFLFAWVKLLK
jgi:hypothetical protein